MNIRQLSPTKLQILNGTVIAGSVLLCLLLLPTRLPGMELLGIGPNWLLIWVVSWSVKRSVYQGAIAGITLGLIQDGMTSTSPSHTLALVVVGVLTAKIDKQRYIREDFISIALIVFAMAVLAETITTLQYALQAIIHFPPCETFDFSLEGGGDCGQLLVHHLAKISEIWQQHQPMTLASAILSSLWAPVVYYPLNRWWGKL
jgi:rod shape-determining protein MreD